MCIKLAGCVIFDHQGKFLLIHRDKNGKEQWEIPGGKINQEESSETAAKRELLEEIGVMVNLVDKIGEATFIENGQKYSYIWFIAKLETNQTKFTLEAGFDNFEYVDVKNLQKSDKHLSEGTKKLLELYTQKLADAVENGDNENTPNGHRDEEWLVR